VEDAYVDIPRGLLVVREMAPLEYVELTFEIGISK
jgi:hypothetical protein